MESVARLILIFPAIAYATTRGGDARKLAFTSWCTLPSKFLFPDNTEQTVKLFFLISLDTHSSRGPELPIQVVHP